MDNVLSKIYFCAILNVCTVVHLQRKKNREKLIEKEMKDIEVEYSAKKCLL